MASMRVLLDRGQTIVECDASQDEASDAAATGAVGRVGRIVEVQRQRAARAFRMWLDQPAEWSASFAFQVEPIIVPNRLTRG